MTVASHQSTKALKYSGLGAAGWTPVPDCPDLKSITHLQWPHQETESHRCGSPQGNAAVIFSLCVFVCASDVSVQCVRFATVSWSLSAAWKGQNSSCNFRLVSRGELSCFYGQRERLIIRCQLHSSHTKRRHIFLFVIKSGTRASSRFPAMCMKLPITDLALISLLSLYFWSRRCLFLFDNLDERDKNWMGDGMKHICIILGRISSTTWTPWLRIILMGIFFFQSLIFRSSSVASRLELLSKRLFVNLYRQLPI